MKKIPQRTCIGCNTQKNKNELIRIVMNKEGQISIDRTGKANGRGAYIKKSQEAVEIARKKKCFQRALECDVEDSLFEELIKIINE